MIDFRNKCPIQKNNISYWIMYIGILIQALFVFWSVAAIHVGTILLIVGWLIKCFLNKKIELPRKDLLMPITLFLSICFLSVCINGDFSSGLKEWKSLFELFFGYYLILNFIQSKHEIKVILSALTFSSVLAAIYGIFQYFSGDIRAEGSTTYMIFASGMMFAAIFNLNLFLAVVSLKKKIIYFTSLILNILALIFTMTRGAWLAFIGALLCQSIFKERKVLILTVVLSLILLLVPSIKERTQTIIDLKMHSNSERLCLWQSSINMVKDHPFLGVGLGRFPKAYQEKYILEQAKERDLAHAHNNFFHYAAELGIIGVMSFTYLLIAILRSCWVSCVNTKDKYLSRVSFSGLLCVLAFIIQGMTEFTFGASVTVRFLFLLIALSLSTKYLLDSRYI